ncbi:hypothetical protein DFH06DRAFT_1226939, partial [Mycena polygramma]
MVGRLFWLFGSLALALSSCSNSHGGQSPTWKQHKQTASFNMQPTDRRYLSSRAMLGNYPSMLRPRRHPFPFQYTRFADAI